MIDYNHDDKNNDEHHNLLSEKNRILSNESSYVQSKPEQAIELERTDSHSQREFEKEMEEVFLDSPRG